MDEYGNESGIRLRRELIVAIFELRSFETSVERSLRINQKRRIYSAFVEMNRLIFNRICGIIILIVL